MAAPVPEAPVVTVEPHAGLAWVSIDNPPVNATSAAVRQGLWDAVERVAALDVRAAVLRCRGRTFVAGGDITEFDAPPVKPDLPDVIARIEGCPVPWIAAMHGSVFGGGLEIALGCAWRVAVPGTSFALPEVSLGIVPGAGGTQRLPRLIGAPDALEMAVSGTPVGTERFLSLGGLDGVVDDLDDGTLVALAARLGARPPAVSDRVVAGAGSAAFAARVAEVVAPGPGPSAPRHAAALVREAGETPFAVGQTRERALHLALRGSAECRALRHVFFAERRVGKPAPGGAPPARIRVSGREDAAARAIAALRDAGLPVEERVGTCRDDGDNGADGAAQVAIRLGRGDVAEVMGQGVDLAPVAKALRRAGALPLLVPPAPGFPGRRLGRALEGAAASLLAEGYGKADVEAAWRAFGGTRALFGNGAADGVPDGGGQHGRAQDDGAQDRPLMDGQAQHGDADAPGLGTRLAAALEDEGNALVREHPGLTDDAIDVLAVRGLGFPRWLGGPMFAARMSKES